MTDLASSWQDTVTEQVCKESEGGENYYTKKISVNENHTLKLITIFIIFITTQ